MIVPFRELYPDVQPRTLTVPAGYPLLPADTYAFHEQYCIDRACDCRRVLLAVVPQRAGKIAATISHAFDVDADGHGLGRSFLDPLNPQSPYAEALLGLFLEKVLDSDYARRLEEHYALAKRAGAGASFARDPVNMAQRALRALRAENAPEDEVAEVLETLDHLGGLQSWRDRLLLARHLAARRRPSRAAAVLTAALADLKGQPRMGNARRELETMLAEVEAKARPTEPNRAEVRVDRPQQKRVRTLRVQAPKTVLAADAEPATQPVPPAPARSPQPRPVDVHTEVSIPPVEIHIEMRTPPALAPALDGMHAEEAGAALARRQLALLAATVAMADRFDHLLCLDGLRGVERMPHQLETARRVLRVLRGRALLADEVGLGKTIEAGIVLSEYLLRGLARTVLLLVPAALVGQWREELATKFGIEAASTEDDDYRADPEGFWSRHDIVVASLETARRERQRQVLASRAYDLVIVDEAHRLKRSTTQGHRLVDTLRSRFLLLLTATPVENDLEELYSIITLLRPGQLATRSDFKRRFVADRDPTAPKNADELRQLLSEVMVRNTRALVDLRLPPRFATTVRCEAGALERELYRHVEGTVAARYGTARDRLALAALIQEAGSSPRAVAATARKMLERPDLDPGLDSLLRPIVNLCRAPVETAKTNRLLALLQAAGAAREKCVVFTRYRETLAYLQEMLDWHQVAHVSFSGSLNGEEKDAAVRALESEVDVMLATEVGGEGRNLQCASTLINFDLPWNPMKLEQRIGRLHRIGQTREVRIYNLCAAGSAEDRILDVLDRRINMFELVIGELDMIIGQLQDERDFAERVLEIYGTARSAVDLDEGFSRLGDDLAAARQHHDRVKRLDQVLFGEDFEA